MQPSTLVFICLCGSRALRPPSPVFTQRRRCSHSATPRGFGGTTKKTKKAKREGRGRGTLPPDGRGRRAERCSYSVGVAQLDAEEAVAFCFLFFGLRRSAAEAARCGAASMALFCNSWWVQGSTAAEADEE